MNPPPAIDAAPFTEASSAIPLVENAVARWSAIQPFFVVGTVCTIAGGLVAAISRPTDFAHGPWLAAYLVLVGGVSQIGLGAGQALLADPTPSGNIVRVETASWNVGLVGVVAGTLVPSPLLTTVGSAASAVALSLLVRGAHPPGRPASRARGILLAFAITLLLSMPIGVALAWSRHG